MQRLDLSPHVLRQYTLGRQVARMGERGENFAGVVEEICKNREDKEAYVGWLKALTPNDVDDVVIARGAQDEPMFAVKEKGRRYLAPVLSDGTLRFAALAAAFFQPSPPSVLMIEEIENGIHPTRLRLLIELLQTQALRTGIQVIATTHSPYALAWLDKDQLGTTFLCSRQTEAGETKIVSLLEIPQFVEALEQHPVHEMFAEGWFELSA